MNIGILFGGKSYEHDISIITANIIYHALKDKHEVLLLYITKDGNFEQPKKMNINDFASDKKYRKFLFAKGGIKVGCKYKDVDVLITTMHGINGEDGLASIICNLYNIPFVGSNHISSGLLMDKYLTYAVLRSNCINTIHTKYFLKNDKININDFPVIVKPARLGSSIGISKITSYDDLERKCKEAFLYDDKIIIQPFIEEFREFNQAAYFTDGNIIVSNVEEVFKSLDILSFEDKYVSSKVGKGHAFVFDEKIIARISEITKKIYSLFELSGIVRIDYIFKDNIIFVNEINTTPGSLAFYLFEEKLEFLLKKLIANSLLEFQNKKDPIFKSSILNQNHLYKKWNNAIIFLTY